MERRPQLAGWLFARRAKIEDRLMEKLGGDRLSPAEFEALRRFRAFTGAALARGSVPPPSLDGVRVDEARVSKLLHTWSESVYELAGPDGSALRESIEPLVAQFQSSLCVSTPARRKRGVARTRRRAVSAAIDRISDAFFAIDPDTGTIADANPAAGALCGVARDALLGRNARSFIPPECQENWWVELEALGESDESRRFQSQVRHTSGMTVPIEATVTRMNRREGSLALVVARSVVPPEA